MARGSRKKSGKGGAAAAVTVAALALMAVSLLVRWSDIGAPSAVSRRHFQLEVLNGTGEPGVAGETTRKLRGMGIDVLMEGNAGRFDFRETLLVDRKGDPELMKRIARRIDCRRVITQVQDRPRVDATLIIGWDREKLELPGR